MIRHRVCCAFLFRTKGVIVVDQTVRYCVVLPDGRKSKPQTFDALKLAFESEQIPEGSQIETIGSPKTQRWDSSEFFVMPEDGSESKLPDIEIPPAEKHVTGPLVLPSVLGIAGGLGMLLVFAVPLGMVLVYGLGGSRHSVLILNVVSGLGLACFGMFLIAFVGFAETSLRILQRILESINRQH